MELSSGRVSLLRLRERAQAAQERTERAQQKVAARKGRRKAEEAQQAAVAPPEVPSFALEPEPSSKRGKSLNSTDVMGWFRGALQQLYGAQLALPEGRAWWTQRDRAVALALLKKWGPERLRTAIEYFVATWPQRLALNEGRTTGMPTLRLFAALREQVFNEAAGTIPMVKFTGGKGASGTRREAARQRGEWQGSVPQRGIGWDDDDE